MIEPHSDLEINVPFMIDANVALPFQKFEMQATLFLRDKPIQIEKKEVITCPVYDPNKFVDVLLITHKGFTQTDYVNIVHIMNTLRLSFQVYDTE